MSLAKTTTKNTSFIFTIISFLLVSNFLFTQTNWVKYAGNPVLVSGTSGSWDDNGVISGNVIYEEGIYKMWYSAEHPFHWQIGYATSTDGINWTKYAGNPVLPIGGTGEWDSQHVADGNVIHDSTGYKMWYAGTENSVPFKIGYAGSTNPNGLVAYYPFNSNANDKSGNGNNGSVNGGVDFTSSDRFGNTYSSATFNGSNGYIATGISINDYSELTLSVWIKSDNAGRHDAMIYARDDPL